jgi:long-chain acyl-CoA synthetase
MDELDRSSVPSLLHVISSSGGDTAAAGAVELAGLLEHEAAPIVERSSDDVAVLVFTSGTAGSPRAAMLSHGNISSNVAQINASSVRQQHASDVGLGLLPFNHAFGLTVVLAGALTTGGSLVLVERFDPQSAFETVARHGVTVMAGAPAMWTALANLPTAPPGTFATVRLATSGADRLPVDVAERLEQRYGLVVHEGYGLTEAGPAVTSSIGQEHRVGSVGTPLPGIDLRLVDEDGTDTLVGDPGELWVRGDNVFLGYWNDPDATGAVLRDGWLRTGDVATVDDDGFLFLVDRAKDLIIVSGFNVYPAEVEAVLMEHPGVEECAVVGVPHPYSGEAVKAFVVVAPGSSYEEDELVAWCGDHLARYKCPSKIMFVDELPHSLHGKLLRRELR